MELNGWMDVTGGNFMLPFNKTNQTLIHTQYFLQDTFSAVWKVRIQSFLYSAIQKLGREMGAGQTSLVLDEGTLLVIFPKAEQDSMISPESHSKSPVTFVRWLTCHGAHLFLVSLHSTFMLQEHKETATYAKEAIKKIHKTQKCKVEGMNSTSSSKLIY